MKQILVKLKNETTVISDSFDMTNCEKLKSIWYKELLINQSLQLGLMIQFCLPNYS